MGEAKRRKKRDQSWGVAKVSRDEMYLHHKANLESLEDIKPEDYRAEARQAFVYSFLLSSYSMTSDEELANMEPAITDLEDIKRQFNIDQVMISYLKLFDQILRDACKKTETDFDALRRRLVHRIKADFDAVVEMLLTQDIDTQLLERLVTTAIVYFDEHQTL